MLSAGSEAFDRGDKFLGCSRISSLRHYVLLSPHQPLIEIFSRETESANWVLRRLFAGDEFTLVPPGVKLNVNEIYDGIALTPAIEAPPG